jgi:hypothetical protein
VPRASDADRLRGTAFTSPQVFSLLSLLAVLVQKYKYWRGGQSSFPHRCSQKKKTFVLVIQSKLSRQSSLQSEGKKKLALPLQTVRLYCTR